MCQSVHPQRIVFFPSPTTTTTTTRWKILTTIDVDLSIAHYVLLGTATGETLRLTQSKAPNHSSYSKKAVQKIKKMLFSSYHLWMSFGLRVGFHLCGISNFPSISFLIGSRHLTNEPLLVCCSPLTLDPIQSLPSNNISQPLVCSILPVMLDSTCSYSPICEGTIFSCGSWVTESLAIGIWIKIENQEKALPLVNPRMSCSIYYVLMRNP